MDKILLTAFLTALAGLITAVLSIVKLVNDKESKITEFRQMWTESARVAMADLIAKINTHVIAVVNYRNMENNLHTELNRLHKSDSDQEKEVLRGVVDFNSEMLKKAFDISIRLLEEVNLAHANVRLHFKPEDPEFVRIEHKIDFYFSKLDEIRRENDSSKWSVLREQVHSATNEITTSSRTLLKSEWEKIKLGEPAYRNTRKWSVWACAGMLVVLVIIGIHAVISNKIPAIGEPRQTEVQTK
ncbi:hypothetical protein ACCC96_01875 [Pseudomonas sp. Pseusp11]|uniref:hypothetical protein n=1 Tax=Pseudomonas sp. Pseusp11 TaxID=3243003 RepID=UPI0039B42631